MDSLFLLVDKGALCGNVRSVIGKTYITEHAIAVNGNNKSDTNFLHYLFLQMDLGRFSDQSAQPGLAVNKLLKLKSNYSKNRRTKKNRKFVTSS